MKKNRAYWQKRFEQIQIAQVNKGAEYYKTLEEEFNRACANIQADIDKWYMRFADSEGITLQEAKKRLNAKELEEFKWTVEEYIEKGKTLKYSDEFARQLENASCRVHISRLEALKLQLQAQVEQLYGNMTDGLDAFIKDTYAHGFYHTCFELEKGIGLGINISDINSRKLETIISNPWASDGNNFSQRIWGKYRPQLVQTLHTELTQACIRGDNPRKLIDKISKRFKATKQQAGNLVMTESAYFSSLSTQDGYKEIGVAQYEILATLDLHTSDICRSLDRKPFPISEYEPWVTAPPFHNRCRSTTCPYFEDEFIVDEKRIARNPDGSQCLVPSSMSYKEWYGEYVKGNAEAELAVKKQKNLYTDKKQYQEYKSILGKEVPESIDDFQNMKYTDSNKWKLLNSKKEFTQKLKKGECNLIVRRVKQQEHILGTKQWRERTAKAIKNGNSGPGAFYKEIDIQDLINRYTAKGIISPPKEFVDTDGIIGIAFDFVSRKYVKTSRIAIHYSVNGTHAFPVIPERS